MQHLLGNQLATIEGDVAAVETYAYVSERHEPRGPWTHWSEGATRYLDTFARGDGQWLLAARAVEGAYSRPPPPR